MEQTCQCPFWPPSIGSVWLRLNFIIFLFSLIPKSLNNLALSHLSNLLQHYVSSWSLRSASQLAVGKTRLKLRGDRCPFSMSNVFFFKPCIQYEVLPLFFKLCFFHVMCSFFEECLLRLLPYWQQETWHGCLSAL